MHPDHLTLLGWWDSAESFDRHWALEKTLTPPGVELLGRRSDRVVGTDSLEIYWEQASYRYDAASDTWSARR